VIVEFIENYSKLSDMEPGDSSVSKNRENFFVCGFYYCSLKKKNVKVILNINALQDQYTDNRDMSQPVKIIRKGDKFVCHG
jgi:hypothetical protein